SAAGGSWAGSKMTRTPHSARIVMLRWNTGCAASGALVQGTAASGRPSPTASLSSPSASVSLIPWAHLLTVLNVAGAITIASAGGRASGSAGSLYSLRTGWPVRSSSAAASRNFMPYGVAITHTSQPCSWAKPTKDGSWSAGGAPQAMTYRTGRGCAAGTEAPFYGGKADSGGVWQSGQLAFLPSRTAAADGAAIWGRYPRWPMLLSCS